jgi:hypothetical protein
VVTLFVPADSKERSDESLSELTVPIEAEATGAPVAITTSEFTPGMPAGLQLSASFQSELTAPVHVDLLMMRLLTLIAMPSGGLAGHDVLSQGLTDCSSLARTQTIAALPSQRCDEPVSCRRPGAKFSTAPLARTRTSYRVILGAVLNPSRQHSLLGVLIFVKYFS